MNLEPNLFLVGTPKSYTTALHQWLVAHPSVVEGPVKEFGALLHSPWATEPWSMKTWPALTESVHRIDSNPWVIYDDAAPARVPIVGSAGDGHVIISLRHPLDRALSMHGDRRASRLEARSVNEALRAELDRSGPDESYPIALDAYLRQSRYDLHLSPWLEAFGPDRLRLFFPDASHGSQLRAIEDWLGLVPTDSVALPVANQSDHSTRRPFAPMIDVARRRLRSLGTAQRLWRRYEPTVAPLVHDVANFRIRSGNRDRLRDTDELDRIDDDLARLLDEWLAPAGGIGSAVGRHKLADLPDWLRG